MADENDYYTKLLHAEHLGDAFKVLVHMYAIKDKLDLTRIEIPENPWDFESAITRWIRSGECPPDVSETTAAASAALLSYEGAPAHLEILDQPEYGGDRLNIIVQANEGSGVLRVVSALGTHQAWRTLGRGQHPLSILVRAWLAHQPRRDRDVQAEARPTAILPTALNTARRELAGQQLPRTLKGGLMGEIQPPRQVELPGLFDDVQTVVPVLPLTLFDRGRRKASDRRAGRARSTAPIFRGADERGKCRAHSRTDRAPHSSTTRHGCMDMAERLAARARLAAIATGAIGAGRDADLLRPAIVAVSWRDRPTGRRYQNGRLNRVTCRASSQFSPRAHDQPGWLASLGACVCPRVANLSEARLPVG